VAARLTRREAGQKVEKSAVGFLKRTGRFEDEARQAIERSLTQAAPGAEKLLVAAVKKHDGSWGRLVKDGVLLDGLRDAHRLALGRTERSVMAVLEDSYAEAIRSITLELRYIERTLAARYRGLTSEVGDLLTDVPASMLEDALSRYAQSEAAALVRFEEGVRHQFQLSRLAEDEPDVVVARVFSPDPVRAKGITGRGVWHRSGGSLTGAMSHASIGGGNAVRQTAMRLFNELAEKRA